MAKTEKRSKKAPKIPTSIQLAVQAAEDKKANELVVLDLRKAQGFTDFFVICSGTNARQIRAIADGVQEALRAQGEKPAHVEGYDRSEWILLDYFDFIVHVFAPETRAFYGLERLWGNAEQVPADGTAEPTADVDQDGAEDAAPPKRPVRAKRSIKAKVLKEETE
ncbi:MAG: ribosome silencing factor [Vicinamibacterales bacterium]